MASLKSTRAAERASVTNAAEFLCPVSLSTESAVLVSRMLILGMHFFNEVTKSRELAGMLNKETPDRIPDFVVPDDPVMDLETGSKFCEAIMSMHFACNKTEG